MLRITFALAAIVAISTTANAQSSQPTNATILIEEVCETVASPNLKGAIDKIVWFSDQANGQTKPDVRVVFVAEGQRVTIRCFPGSEVFGPRITVLTRPNGSSDDRSLNGTDWGIEFHYGPAINWECGWNHGCDLLEPTLRLAQKTLRP